MTVSESKYPTAYMYLRQLLQYQGVDKTQATLIRDHIWAQQYKTSEKIEEWLYHVRGQLHDGMRTTSIELAYIMSGRIHDLAGFLRMGDKMFARWVEKGLFDCEACGKETSIHDKWDYRSSDAARICRQCWTDYEGSRRKEEVPA